MGDDSLGLLGGRDESGEEEEDVDGGEQESGDDDSSNGETVRQQRLFHTAFAAFNALHNDTAAFSRLL